MLNKIKHNAARLNHRIAVAQNQPKSAGYRPYIARNSKVGALHDLNLFREKLLAIYELDPPLHRLFSIDRLIRILNPHAVIEMPDPPPARTTDLTREEFRTLCNELAAAMRRLAMVYEKLPDFKPDAMAPLRACFDIALERLMEHDRFREKRFIPQLPTMPDYGEALPLPVKTENITMEQNDEFRMIYRMAIKRFEEGGCSSPRDAYSKVLDL